MNEISHIGEWNKSWAPYEVKKTFLYLNDFIY